MLAPLLMLALTLQAAANPQAASSAAQQPATVNRNAPADADDPAALLKVKRIYVDSFGDDAASQEIQSMIVSSLVATKRFRVTEDREKADAVLKGVALGKSSQEFHAYHEGTAAGSAAISDSAAHTETVSEAKLSIRLVNPDGDVIWTTTQESKGAKYKGASADVADMCVKQLLKDVAKLEGSTGTAPATPAAHEHN